MELEDLKKSWQVFGENIAPPKKEIAELIRSGSEQPLEKLKARFRKGMLLMPLVAAVVIIQFSHKKDFASQFLVWYLVCFSAVMLVYFSVNYRLVTKMQSNEGDVLSNLVRQTKLLTRLLQLRLLLMRGAMILFCVLSELLIYFRNGKGFESWQAHSITYRLSVYTLIFVLFFFFTRIAINHRYRKNILRLQSLIKEAEEV